MTSMVDKLLGAVVLFTILGVIAHAFNLSDQSGIGAGLAVGGYLVFTK